MQSSKADETRLHTAHFILLAAFGLYLLYGRLCRYLPFYEYKFPVLLISQLLFVIPGMLVLRMQGEDWAKRIRFTVPDGRNVLMGLITMVCAYPLAVLMNLLSQLFVENQVTTVVAYMLQLGLGPSIFILALMPAFTEEFLFRGILYWNAYRDRSKVEGILVSALAFGLMHLNLNQFFYAFFLGIIFALMVEATDSIVVSMIMHFSVNAFNVLVSYMAGSAGVQDASSDQAALVLTEGMNAPGQVIIAVCSILAVCVLLILTIYRTFTLNGRSLRREEAADSGQRKKHPADLLLAVYIATALVITVQSTVFH